MKQATILFFAFLIPVIVFAGGKHHTPPPTTQPPVVVTQPTPVPVVVPMYVAPPATHGPGGAQIYCSGPTAPGWTNGLPDGGCGPKKPISKIDIGTSTLPYTGLTFWGWFKQLFL